MTATSSQILAISFIKDLTGTEISWMKWFIASAPVAIITLAASFHLKKRGIPSLKKSRKKPC